MPLFKDICSGKELHQRMLAGVNKLADPVCDTMGPGGLNACIEMLSGTPHITKDGYTVAKSILLEDAVESMGAELVKQAAIKQNETSGDGTTTTTCLAQALYTKSVQLMNDGVHPAKIKGHLESLQAKVVSNIQSMSRQVTEDDYFDVAMVSSNGDEQVSKLVSDAWKATGEDGYVMTTFAKVQETDMHITTGYLAEGYVPNPAFLTSEGSGRAEYDESLVLLLTGVKELTLGQLKPALEYWQDAYPELPLVIIARAMREDVLGMLYKNRLERGLNVLPLLTDIMDHETFEDLGAYLDCPVFSDTELDFASAAKAGRIFGRCKSVSYKGRRMSLIPRDDHVFTARYHERVNLLKELKKASGSSEESREYSSSRLGKLTGGVAVIQVGAQTESEAKELKDRYDDAVHAVRSTFGQGVVPGSGATLFNVATREDVVNNPFSTCLQAPSIRLYKNAGLEFVDTSQLSKPFNLKTDQYDERIVDPTKVVTDAVKDAVSVAILLTMTQNAIVMNNESADELRKMVLDNR